ncbi:MAG: Gfo/Idh/MocA family oxidoreductase [Bacteroidaceae bacterium]|nr:Gfo/Idh/MocA family oxidoreductase [Bacteroidaceae bacterium]
MISIDTVSGHKKKPISVVAIGAGNRMRTYMHYVEQHPDLVQLVAIVERDAIRRNAMATRFAITRQNIYKDYEDFFQRPVSADAVLICTPDDEHYRPCMMALERGYHVLLEKPIAQTIEQCEDIARVAQEKSLIVCVCHVMRYHPCFIKIKELIDGGTLGRLISINHIERVGLDRATHSYVRGIWNRAETSNPMVLAKCCHDVDFLLWITKGRCRKISSFGGLRWFRQDNAPAGSAERCVHCQVEPSCPYSAVNLYLERHDWISNFDVPDGKTLDDVIRQELKDGRLGRCVFHCDNNVVDQQAVMMEMEDGVTISLSMDIFTQQDNRQISIRLTNGEIESDEQKVKVTYFRERRQETFDFSGVISQPYHGGADLKIMEEFVQAIRGSRHHLPSAISDSVESHRICFEAERSRLAGRTIELN